MLLPVSALASGPTSTLYLMNYGEFSSGTVVGLDLIQGVTENSYATANASDVNLAVYGDVRTFGYFVNDPGSRFDLAGNPLPGGPYVNSYGGQLHDGTSDGNYNYTVDYTTGDVLQFDRNWASPVVLFNPLGPLTTGWITMDAGDGSFWLSQYGNSDLVEHRTHAGSLISSFNSGINYSQGLALDPVDGTLWMSSGYTLYQFSQAGTPLQNISYNSVQGGGWYGMEFDTTPVPEPSALAFAAAGLGMLLRGRRRRSLS
jgi:MYXO-CTERM domain-containing protein